MMYATLVLALFAQFFSVQSTRSPIVIVPGLLGSQLEAKLDKDSSPNLLCRKKSDWFTLWINLDLAAPGVDECFVDNVKLIYDENTKEYYNNSGVQVRVPGFGTTDSIEYLDDSAIYKYPYFNKFVKYFEGLGYTKGKDLIGAPFDWRFAPDQLSKLGYYDALFVLIEDAYRRNGRTPVTLIAHSLGGPVSLYFLSRIAPSGWKDSTIKQYISLSSAFGGSLHVLLGIISGDVEGLYTARPLVLRESQRSNPSQVLLLPSSQLWKDDEVLVVQPKRNYTAFNYEELFADISYTNGSRMYNEVKNLISDFPPPNVTHYCYYGTDVKTIDTYIYGDTFPNGPPSDFVYGNGDGTVNARSLQTCNLWKDKQVYPVMMKSYSKVSHFDMVSDENVLQDLGKLLT